MNGIADNVTRNVSYPREIKLIYVTGRRISSVERTGLKRFRRSYDFPYFWTDQEPNGPHFEIVPALYPQHPDISDTGGTGGTEKPR